MRKAVRDMMINTSVQSVAGVYAKNTATSVKKTARNSAIDNSDEIVLSSEVKSFSAALQQLQNTSGDVRQDKVDLYADQIANGTYDVSASNIAASMLQLRY